MFKLKIPALIIIFICSLQLQMLAQPRTWVDRFSYTSIDKVMRINQYIVGLGENGLLIYDTIDKGIHKISKVHGLSSIGLSTMAYDTVRKNIILGYDNGYIDIVSIPDITITSISDIYHKQISSSKRINTFTICNDTLYIAANFGLVTYNLEKNIFLHTTIFGSQNQYVAVNDVEVNSETNTVYAATDAGLYYVNSNKNISDVSIWSKVFNSNLLAQQIKQLFVFRDSLYVIPKFEVSENVFNTDTLYVNRNNTLEQFGSVALNPNSVTVYDSVLIITADNKISLFNKNWELIDTIVKEDLSSKSNLFRHAIISENKIWIADVYNGIVLKDPYFSVAPTGPYSNVISDLHFINNKLYVSNGDRQNFKYGMINVMQNNYWYGHINWDVRNTIAVYVYPKEDRVYYGTYGWGLVQCETIEGYDTIFNKTNSTLETNGYYECVNRIVGDYANNIWMSNWWTDGPLVVKTKNSKWHSYSIDNLRSIFDIYIDKNNTKWIAGGENLYAFSENNTFDITSDDKLVTIPLVDNEGSIASQTTAFAMDLDGALWIGTSQGIAIHANPLDVFKGNNSISRPKITINDELGYLLSSQFITKIFVDAANRKWIGTRSSGIFLISEDGSQQLEHFTVENSALPSNNIISITINQSSGEVFIATDKGLVSYVSNVALGVEEMSTVQVFPNPIRQTLTETMYIRGLVANANIKITDMAGNFVFETTSNGSIGEWNIRNFKGNKVATGTYLIYISDAEGKNTSVKKVLVVK